LSDIAATHKMGAVGIRDASDMKILEASRGRRRTPRAHLRRDLTNKALERRQDFSVDWVYLKLSDQAQRTVLCKDPFRAYDERVQRLIDGM
jgi:proteasome accessory factor A